MPALADIIPRDIRAQMAFELLASSSIARYARVARSFASDPRVQEAFDAHGIAVQELLTVATETLRLIATGALRDEREVDLALALAVLAKSADEKVDEFLRQVGMFERPVLSWIGALARNLYYKRPANLTAESVGKHPILILLRSEGEADSIPARNMESWSYLGIEAIFGVSPPYTGSEHYFSMSSEVVRPSMLLRGGGFVSVRARQDSSSVDDKFA